MTIREKYAEEVEMSNDSMDAKKARLKSDGCYAEWLEAKVSSMEAALKQIAENAENADCQVASDTTCQASRIARRALEEKKP